MTINDLEIEAGGKICEYDSLKVYIQAFDIHKNLASFISDQFWTLITQ